MKAKQLAEAIDYLLERAGVDSSHWQETSGKSVDDLIREVCEGERSLVFDSHGISLMTKIVKATIRDLGRGNLVEYSRTLPNGTTLLSESGKKLVSKICDETPLEALERGLMEELGLDCRQCERVIFQSVVTEEAGSVSYPSLRGIYVIHSFLVMLSQPNDLPDEIVCRKGDRTIVFRWELLPASHYEHLG